LIGNVKREGEVMFETTARVPASRGPLDGRLAGRRRLGAPSATDLEAVLNAADRSRCGQVAPPSGLYLARVDYSDR
jgi:tRNA pseudouridine38-40 synthase